MIALRRLTHSTPRLLFVGLFALSAACHKRKLPVITPMPAPPPRPPSAPPAAASRAVPELTIRDGAGLITAMHARYASSWYHSMTFVQKTTVGLASGGELQQTWYEAAELPGRLRIDTDLASRSGVLFARDSIFRFANGKLSQADTGTNDLLVLGFDVYMQPAATTDSVLRHLGFDLSKVHESTWHGKRVYVVGADAGDSTTKQFWVDRDRLLFVRMLQQNPRRGHIDVRFDDYVRAGDGWIAKRVEQLVNGKRTLLEEYTDVQTDVTLSPELFDPEQWATVRHWRH